MRVPSTVEKESFDYIKTGPYIAHLGGLKHAPPTSASTSVWPMVSLAILRLGFGARGF
jgi:hypothetical protein